jgi:hypothetical protein
MCLGGRCFPTLPFTVNAAHTRIHLPATRRHQVWAVPTTQMQCEWLGERVATVDVGRAIANVVHGREDAGWGPNAVFRFPKRGGTGAMWRGVAALLPRERQVSRRRPEGSIGNWCAVHATPLLLLAGQPWRVQPCW